MTTEDRQDTGHALADIPRIIDTLHHYQHCARDWRADPLLAPLLGDIDAHLDTAHAAVSVVLDDLSRICGLPARQR